MRRGFQNLMGSRCMAEVIMLIAAPLLRLVALILLQVATINKASNHWSFGIQDVCYWILPCRIKGA